VRGVANRHILRRQTLATVCQLLAERMSCATLLPTLQPECTLSSVTIIPFNSRRSLTTTASNNRKP
ncbi:MAG: hypothetical protein ACO37F_10510, partial [Pirellulales bacterium]